MHAVVIFEDNTFKTTEVEDSIFDALKLELKSLCDALEVIEEDRMWCSADGHDGIAFLDVPPCDPVTSWDSLHTLVFSEQLNAAMDIIHGRCR